LKHWAFGCLCDFPVQSTIYEIANNVLDFSEFKRFKTLIVGEEVFPNDRPRKQQGFEIHKFTKVQQGFEISRDSDHGIRRKTPNFQECLR